MIQNNVRCIYTMHAQAFLIIINLKKKRTFKGWVCEWFWSFNYRQNIWLEKNYFESIVFPLISQVLLMRFSIVYIKSTLSQICNQYVRF